MTPIWKDLALSCGVKRRLTVDIDNADDTLEGISQHIGLGRCVRCCDIFITLTSVCLSDNAIRLPFNETPATANRRRLAGHKAVSSAAAQLAPSTGNRICRRRRLRYLPTSGPTDRSLPARQSSSSRDERFVV